MATKLEELAAAQALVEKLKKEAAADIAAQKKQTIAEILDHMAENDITLRELADFERVSKSKYSSGTDTWTGKGKQPEWVTKALASGKKLEDLLTPKAPAASA